jgi:hypothetical protein
MCEFADEMDRAAPRTNLRLRVSFGQDGKQQVKQVHAPAPPPNLEQNNPHDHLCPISRPIDTPQGP